MAVIMSVFVRYVALALQTMLRFTATHPEAGGLLVVREGRLLWLTTWEWALLLASAALCGCLTLLGA
jgi:hypothetical protein